MSIDWSKVGEAVDDGNGIVTPGSVVDKAELELAFDEMRCGCCGKIVRISNFICPHCNGKVRTKPQPVETATPAKSMSSCWECHREIGRTARICPHCGADQKKKPLSVPLWFMLCFFAALFLLIAVVTSGVRKQNEEERGWREFEAELREKYGDK